MQTIIQLINVSFFDPVDRFIHTQTVEKIWRKTKIRILVNLKGSTIKLLIPILIFFISL